MHLDLRLPSLLMLGLDQGLKLLHIFELLAYIMVGPPRE